MYQKMSKSTPAETLRFQDMTNPAVAPHGSGRPKERRRPNSWHHSHRETTGLVYVMDDPTGGVWMKPRETWTRS